MIDESHDPSRSVDDGSERLSRAPQRPSALVFASWILAVAWGFLLLAMYSHSKGPLSTPPRVSPLASEPSPADAPFHLFVSLHPQCPCSRATIAELERLIAKTKGQLSCTVLAYKPDSASIDWLDTPTFKTARILPFTKVVPDVDGRRIQQLGIRTSGAVVLYDTSGVLRFHGGITFARGHEGDNVGAQVIREIVEGQRWSAKATPVFGCPILTD